MILKWNGPWLVGSHAPQPISAPVHGRRARVYPSHALPLQPLVPRGCSLRLRRCVLHYFAYLSVGRYEGWAARLVHGFDGDQELMVL